MGPVQVLVVGLDRASMHGEVLSELTRLSQAGIVRLVDALLVSCDEDGTVESLEMPAGTAEGLGELTASLLGVGAGEAAEVHDRSDPDDGGSTWSLAQALPAGSVAAVALIEHMWAGPLRDAIRRSGGAPIDETWLAAEDASRLEALLRVR